MQELRVACARAQTSRDKAEMRCADLEGELETQRAAAMALRQVLQSEPIVQMMLHVCQETQTILKHVQLAQSMFSLLLCPFPSSSSAGRDITPFWG